MNLAYDAPDIPDYSAWGCLYNVTWGGPACTFGLSFAETYAYAPWGAVAIKTLAMTQNNTTLTLTASWGYNNEGQVTSIIYPQGPWYDPPKFAYSYDTMGRPNGMTKPTPTTTSTVIANVAYGPAGELLQFQNQYPNNPSAPTQTFTYNNRLQLTNMRIPGALDMTYAYPAGGQNNGRIQSQYDAIHNENVSFTYDSLNRLTDAVSASWNVHESLDGFGNRNAQTGTGPHFSNAAAPGTNRIIGYSYDANGNLTQLGSLSSLVYDVENRLAQATTTGGVTEQYAYDPRNQRVLKSVVGGDAYVYFHAPDGRRLGTYKLGNDNQTGAIIFETGTFYSLDAYFAGRQVIINNGIADLDRLGSGGTTTHYPYGEAQNIYATYERDSVTGLHYANQRYYSSTIGRFITPDPYQASGGPMDPQSWNRYTYVENDPGNQIDPNGLMTYPGAPACNVDGIDVPCSSVFGPDGTLLGGGGGGGGGTGAGGGAGFSSGFADATLAGLAQYFQGLAFSILPGTIALPGSIGITICAASGVCAVIATVGAVATAGVLIYVIVNNIDFGTIFSKGGKQNVAHAWVWELAKQMNSKDPCSALKDIQDEARQSGDNDTFNAAKATWKQYCR